MKKEIILPFPAYDKERTNPTEVTDDSIPVRPRMKFKIGKPSKNYFEFIYASLHFEKHTLGDLKSLLKFQGTEVEVVGILTMKDGSSIASLCKPDGKKFSEGMERLFADVKKSIRAKELLR